MKCGETVLQLLEKAFSLTIGEQNYTEAKGLEFKLNAMKLLGGEEHYIPKIECDARRKAILKEFNGRNRKELCAKYSISKAQFYRFMKGE